MKQKVSFIGLGTMGFPMAGFLAKKNYPTTVFNRTAEKSIQWCQKYSGKKENTPALAAQDSDFVFLCVGNDKDVLSVVEGEDGVLATMKKGSCLIDHTTTSAKLARHLAEKCKLLEIDFLDAPISGGQVGAENGKLTIMVGGKESVFALAKPILESYAQKIERMGEVGQGQLTKMVNQICIAGLVQALSEAIHFGETVGVNLEKAMEVLGKGAAQSWQMDNRAKTMIEGNFDFGFALDWMRKDLSFCLEEAKEKNISLPITQLVDSYYQQLQKMGYGRCDTSALIENLRKKNSFQEDE